MRWAVVHLVRKANDPRDFLAFLEACRRFPGGMGYELVIAAKGFGTDEPWPVQLEGVPHRRIDFSDEGFDLGPYRQVAERVEATGFIFVNSFTVPLAPNWAAHLVAALEATPRAGVVGAMGSYERIEDGPWPNIHIRTTGFALRREVCLSLEWPRIDTKKDSNRFEAGSHSLTKQIMARGLEPYVVDRHGRAWGWRDWPKSRTWRSGGQEGLLLADRRAREYVAARREVREWLEQLAWMEGPLPPRPINFWDRVRNKLEHLRGT